MIILVLTLDVRSNKVVLKWLVDCEICGIDVFFEVSPFLVRLDHRSALGASDVADIEPIALLGHVLLGVSNKHHLI